MSVANTDGLIMIKQGYANILGAASVSISPHQRTRSGTCQRRRKSLIKVRLWGYHTKYVKVIIRENEFLLSLPHYLLVRLFSNYF